MAWIVLAVCFIINTFYVWKLEQDFKEWATDIDVEFFKHYSKFKED